MRAFAWQSSLEEGNLTLALAPALTPKGLEQNPCFFKGFIAHPQILARTLLVLADVTATRYFNYVPVSMRDPILSAQGRMLRAECFSAENSVYARLDLLEEGFDGQIGFGTTNVDIGSELRAALAGVKMGDKLHLNIGADGLTAAHFTDTDKALKRLRKTVSERPVQMPDRWLRALGNAAEIHRSLAPRFSVQGRQAQAFVASLPPATAKNQGGWLTPTRSGIQLCPRPTPTSVHVSGLHRLSALKRVMTNVTGLNFYDDGEAGAFMIEVEVPAARLTLSLTAEAWQGYSGEGALLESLARPELLEDAEAIAAELSFNPAIDETRWDMSESRRREALALLAVSGKLGFDAHEGAYYHRELPDDPDRILKDNPRLKAAQKLVENVRKSGDRQWFIRSGEADYRVTYDTSADARNAQCTCAWYLKHQNKRGPCKHILAVQLAEGLA